MSDVIKTYFVLFLVLFGVCSFIGIISADMDIHHANELKTSIVNEVENSNFSPSVIQACKDSVAENTDYNLSINEITDAEGNTVMAEIVVTFDYTIPFFNYINPGHETRSFAR